MFRNFVILTYLIVYASTLGLSQKHINFEELDTIFVEVDQNAQAYYQHKLLQGETLYSLSKYFQVNYQDLLITNGLSESDIIPLGTYIKIPLNLDYLITSPRTHANNFEIPVVYKVKKLETLFKISQVYFNQKIEYLVARNKIRKLSLRTGKELIVGYWTGVVNRREKISKLQIIGDSSSPVISLTNTKIDSFNQYKLTTTAPELIDLSSDSFELNNNLNIISAQGIALWERSDTNVETLLVLHKTARPGSVIKLLNPVTDRIVVAQVVGTIPENVYTKDIDAIVSRAVAQKLGALDTRFQITMTFYE